MSYGRFLRGIQARPGRQGVTMMRNSLNAMLALLRALPSSKACHISIPGNVMPAYMTVDQRDLSKR